VRNEEREARTREKRKVKGPRGLGGKGNGECYHGMWIHLGANWVDESGISRITIYTNNDLDLYNSDSTRGKARTGLSKGPIVGHSDLRACLHGSSRHGLRRLRTVRITSFSVPNLLESRFSELADQLDRAVGKATPDRDFSKWGLMGDRWRKHGGWRLANHIDHIKNVYCRGEQGFLNSPTLAGGGMFPTSQPLDAGNSLTSS